MQTVIKNWGNGDELKLEKGDGVITVSSSKNTTGKRRSLSVKVKTTGNESLNIGVEVVQRYLEYDVFAVGLNTDGELGLGDTESRRVLTRLRPPVDGAMWINIAGGDRHTLGVLNNGTLYGWGYNRNYQIAQTTMQSELSPVLISDMTGWTSIAAGFEDSFGICNGMLYHWGSNKDGEAGNGIKMFDYTPTNENGEAVDINTHNNRPTLVTQDTDWDDVKFMTHHVLALRSGKLYSWGLNDHGQLGHGDTKERLRPTQVGTSDKWTKIAVSGYGSYGICDGKLYSWGWGKDGNLGHGDTIDRLSPTQVGTYSDWKQVSAGLYRVSAIRGGQLYAAGEAYIGFGIERTYSLARVGSANDWEFTTCGWGNTYAINKNGELWACGRNVYGNDGKAYDKLEYLTRILDKNQDRFARVWAGRFFSFIAK